jgi:hypothetical protein
LVNYVDPLEGLLNTPVEKMKLEIPLVLINIAASLRLLQIRELHLTRQCETIAAPGGENLLIVGMQGIEN